MSNLNGVNLSQIVEDKAEEICKQTVDTLTKSDYYTSHEIGDLLKHAFLAGSRFTIKQLKSE